MTAGARSSVLGEFEAWVARAPGAPALVKGSQALSYAGLDARANGIAHRLCASGVSREDHVAVCLPRSFDAIAALLGIWKAGAVYVPVDPAYPRQRIEYLMSDARPRVIVSQRRLAERWMSSDASLLLLDDALPLASESGAVAGVPFEDQAAYVIYTSGSTGKPKGAVVCHGALRLFALAQSEYLGITRQDRMLQFASLSFDASIFEICTALSSGAALVLADASGAQSWAKTIRDQRPTIALLPPTMLEQLDPREASSLRVLISAGEACSARIMESWRPGRRFLNAYGPTEATVYATIADCSNTEGTPAIGRPFEGVDVLLAGPDMAEVRPGEPGELYILGVGVGRGYLNRPSLTAERFVPDPRPGAYGKRAYRTGDVVRLRPDGDIAFVGRVDHQLKIRGHRIEPGEIEAALASHACVGSALVTGAAEPETGLKFLVAYLLPAAGERLPSLSALRSFLGGFLPQHMIPSRFIEMREWPLTANGKVDRRALPEPHTARPLLEQPFVAPETELERLVARIVERVVRVEPVGLHDGFLELGGDSIMALQVASRVKEQGHDVELPTVFEEWTVASLVEAIEERPRRPEASMLQGPQRSQM